MSKYRLIFYDTETTGLPQYEDRRASGLFSERSIFDVHVIELAAYDSKTGESFNALIKPPISIPEDATAIHHISNEMVESSPDFSVVGASFIDWLSKHIDDDEKLVFVAHNGNGFDNPVLLGQCKRYGLEMPTFLSLDSLKVFRGLIPSNKVFKEVSLPSRGTFKLTTLAGALMTPSELESISAHRALDDVQMLHRVFEIITEGSSTAQLLRSYGKTYKSAYKHEGTTCNLLELPPITRLPLAEALRSSPAPISVEKRPHQGGIDEERETKKPRLMAGIGEIEATSNVYSALKSPGAISPF